MENALPLIPAKRYFTIGEVSDLCGVKPHVLRYWEQEFTQLRPMKRRGNRRYYQHHEVLMIRRIRDLLYDQGFTISGARNQMQETHQFARDDGIVAEATLEGIDVIEISEMNDVNCTDIQSKDTFEVTSDSMLLVRRELFEIRALLSLAH
jgi:DNA-binding transcriptional MerR regulator